MYLWIYSLVCNRILWLRPFLISITYNFRFHESNFRIVDLKITIFWLLKFPTPHSLYELEVNIRREIGSLDPAVSQMAIYEVRSRAQKSLVGGHFKLIVLNCKLNCHGTFYLAYKIVIFRSTSLNLDLCT